MRYLFSAALVLSCCVTAAFAQDVKSAVAAPGAAEEKKPSCEMREKTTLTLRLRGSEENAAKIPELVAAKRAKVEALAKEAGLSKVELQNEEIRVDSREQRYDEEGGAHFRYSGSFSYLVEPSDKATVLLGTLEKENLKGSVAARKQLECQGGRYPR